MTCPASCIISVSIPSLFNSSNTVSIRIDVFPFFLALLLIAITFISTSIFNTSHVFHDDLIY
ncbi:hypothetical protein LI097_04275 [Erysipelatoclostridium ramosum]|nr:hypothetical protein [Thomasclavelia ramosa]